MANSILEVIITKNTIFDNKDFPDTYFNCKLNENIIFNNKSSVNFRYLTKITKGTKFLNKGDIIFYYLEEIDNDVLFLNKGLIYINKSTSIILKNIQNLDIHTLMDIYERLPIDLDKYICKKDLLSILREKQLVKILL